MKRMFQSGLAALLLTVVSVAVAHAWAIEGRVICGDTQEGVSGVEIEVVSTTVEHPFSSSAVSDGNGYYIIPLPEEVDACYRATIVLGAGQSAINPASGYVEFCLSDANKSVVQDWVIDSPECGETEEGACWLTAGGAKFNALIGGNVGEYGPKHSWGGNVFPGCSPTAGDGGNWNHIAHSAKLHFQGTAIQVVRCGNIAGIPPGSESPVTPFNFIEFTGTGTLKGIHGNKLNIPVYFWAHVQDRNEPGSSGAKDGDLMDRYFLHVYTNAASPATSTVLLIDLDGDPTTVDPVTITHGNMQIHISSCDFEPAGLRAAVEALHQNSAATPLTSWGKLKVIYR